MKVYDTSTYQVVQTLDFPAPVLAAGLSVSRIMSLYGPQAIHLIALLSYLSKVISSLVLHCALTHL